MRKLKNKYPYLLIVALIALVSGCKLSKPHDVLSEAQMEQILYDYTVAKSMGDALQYSENYKRAMYIEYVFGKHGTTEAVFDSSLVWYTRNTKVLQGIYEKINKRFKEQQTEINRLIAIRDDKPITSTPGDSIDVWAWDRLYRLTGNPLSNRVSFTLPSDTNFKSRDTLLWEANYHFIGAKTDSVYQAAIMSMAITYANDSIISSTKKITESGRYGIRLQSDTLGEIREIKGFIYYPGETNSATTLLTDSISLIRYHSTDGLTFDNADSTANTKPETFEAIPIEKMTVDEPSPVVIEDSKEGAIRRTERPRPVQRTQAVQEREAE